MGYRFTKKGADLPFFIRLSDASTVRHVALLAYGSAGVASMPDPERSGGTLVRPAVRDAIVTEARAQARLLEDLADYFEGAEDLRWEH